jgi:hypothetical protein
MKNFFAVVIFLLLVGTGVNAQDSTRTRSSLSVSIGASMPLGQFKAASSSRDGHGFATSGFHYQIEYAGFWSRNAGFGVEAGGFSNGLNQNPFKTDFTILHPPPVFVGNVNLSAAEPWRNYYLLTGPYISLPMKNIIVDFKALGGLLFTKSASMIYTLTTTTTTYASGTAGGVSSQSFGYSLGTNIRLKLDKNTQLKFSVEYLQGYVDTSYTNSSPTYPVAGAGQQSLAVLNLSWGLTFLVGRK